MTETFDAVVIGGGPAGSTAAADLARNGRSVLLLDRAGRIKPCGGAIPPVCVREFAIPDSQIVARATGARIVSPTAKEADMPITGGYVGMVDREGFDEYLRERAADAGAERRTGTFDKVGRDPDGVAVVHYKTTDGPAQVRARAIIGSVTCGLPQLGQPSDLWCESCKGIPVVSATRRASAMLSTSVSPSLRIWVA